MAHPAPRRPVQEAGVLFNTASEELPCGLSLGFWFFVDVPGFIVQAAWVQSHSDNSGRIATLLSNTNVNLRTNAWVPATTAGGEGGASWVRRNIKPGWRVEPGNFYRFVVWMGGIFYEFKPHQLDTVGLDAGQIHIPPSGFAGGTPNGIFQYGAPYQAITGDFNNTLYAVDVGFQPESGP